MKKILTGDEQLKDTFVCTLVKLFGVEKYDIMEKFCNEIEISFSILDDRKLNPNEYFEFLNEIKSNLMEEYRNSSSDCDTKMNIEIKYNPDEMDMDVSKKESFLNVSKLLEEAYSVEPSNSEEFINPIFNTNFYIIFFLILIINNQMDSARYLYKRLPKPVLSNRTIVFIKVFLSFMLKKDIGKALSVLNKEIEVEIKKLNVSVEKEEDYIEEDIVEKNENEMNVISQKGKDEAKSQEDNDEKMDIYPSDKSGEVVAELNKGKMNNLSVIENNTPEYSSETTMNATHLPQVETPEETMRDIDDNDNTNEEEDDDDDDDDDEEDDDDNDSNDENNKNENISSFNKTMLKITEDVTKIHDNTMTPTDIETPHSFASISENLTNTNNNVHIKKSYFKIKRCSLFIKELLLCLLESTRKRQINLIAKAYDHILVKEVAKTLDYPEDKIISYITENYGWDIEPAQDQNGEMMFIPKREEKENKQEMNIYHIDTLINHLIFLEDSDKIQTIERF